MVMCTHSLLGTVELLVELGVSGLGHWEMSFEKPEHDGAAERNGCTQVRVCGERLFERRLARRLQPNHDGVPVG